MPNMPQKHIYTRRNGCIDVQFNMDSTALLWNIIFEGFDEDIDIKSDFIGNSSLAVATLHDFCKKASPICLECNILKCPWGISIVKTFPIHDTAKINQWTDLMYQVQDEVVKLVSHQIAISHRVA